MMSRKMTCVESLSSSSSSTVPTLKSALAVRDTTTTTTTSTNSLLSSQTLQSEQHADEMTMADVGNIRQQRQATCFLEDEEPPRVFLSLIWADCRLGAAYYDSQTATLYVMNDVIEEALEFAMTKKVVQLVNATCVITSSKSDARFLKMLKELGQKQI